MVTRYVATVKAFGVADEGESGAVTSGWSTIGGSQKAAKIAKRNARNLRPPRGDRQGRGEWGSRTASRRFIIFAEVRSVGRGMNVTDSP